MALWRRGLSEGSKEKLTELVGLLLVYKVLSFALAMLPDPLTGLPKRTLVTIIACQQHHKSAKC